MPQVFHAPFLVSIKPPVGLRATRSIPLHVRKKSALAPRASEEITTPQLYFCSSYINNITYHL